MYQKPELTMDQINDETVVLTRQDPRGEWRRYASDLAVEFGIATDLMFCDIHRRMVGVAETKTARGDRVMGPTLIERGTCGCWML